MLTNTGSNFGFELLALYEVIQLLLILPWFHKLILQSFHFPHPVPFYVIFRFSTMSVEK